MKPFGVFIIVPAPTRTRDSENIRIQKVVLPVIFEMYMLRYNFVFLYIYEYILSQNQVPRLGLLWRSKNIFFI